MRTLTHQHHLIGNAIYDFLARETRVLRTLAE
jgi:hypothetical protein